MKLRSRRARAAVAAGAVVVLAAAAAVVVLARSGPDPFDGLPASPALDVIRSMGHGHGVTAAEGRLLYDEVVARGYRRGVDVGTAHGYAALWLGLALRHNGGRLVTIEIDPQTARVAAENFRRARLEEVELRVADALVELPRIDAPLDFVFLDPGVAINRRLLDSVAARIPAGGAVFAHNANLFRWTQPDFHEAISGPPWQTRYRGFGWRVSVSVKATSPAR